MCVSCIKENMISNNNKITHNSDCDMSSDISGCPSIIARDSKGQINLESENNSNQPRVRKIYLPLEEEEQESLINKDNTTKANHLSSTSKYFPISSSEFSDFKKIKRSFSFGGFGLFSCGGTLGEITSQEIEAMLDPVVRKEPSKTSKKQIKEYSQKYKHLKGNKDKNVPWYRDPLEYTQPAHLVTCFAILYLAFRLFPDSRRSLTEASTLTRLLYLASISAVFGSQFWMTFVSGLALFFSIPRHMFAKVQSVLFPLYFLTNAGLLMISIVTYTQIHPTHLWNNHQLIQGGILVAGFIINLGIRLYLAPILGKLIAIKVAIEAEAEMGSEIGSNEPGVLLKCPHYMKLYRAFRRLHIIIAIGNMATMAGTSFHLYYLATKFCF